MKRTARFLFNFLRHFGCWKERLFSGGSLSSRIYKYGVELPTQVLALGEMPGSKFIRLEVQVSLSGIIKVGSEAE
jgi:hypothetical protein